MLTVWAEVIRVLTPRHMVVAAVILLAACSAGPTESNESQATPDGVAASGSAPTVQPALPDPIVNHAPVTRLDAHLTAVLNVPGDPDWLEVGAGSLWVKRDDGQVSRIDLRKAEQTGHWTTGYTRVPACQGLTYDGRYLWSCAGENHLVRHDPTVGGAADRIGVPRLSDQTRFVSSHNLVWVINAEATGLTGLDRTTGAAGTAIKLGAFCTDLARPLGHDRNVVYAVCPTDGLVLAVDVAAGKVTRRLHLADPRAATVATDLWVGFADGLAQVDPRSLEVEAVYDLDLGLYGEIWADSHDVWVRAPGSEMLTHIDPRRHRFLETLTSSAYPSGGDVLIFGDTLWTTASDDGVVLKVHPGPGAQ